MKTYGKALAVIGSLLLVLTVLMSGKMARNYVKKTFSPSAGESAAGNLNQNELNEVIEKAVLESTKKINEQLPMMVDKETRFDTATCIGKQVIYKYTMINLSEKDTDGVSLERPTNKLKANAIKGALSDNNATYTLKHGVEYQYMYFDKNGVLLTSFTLSADDLKR